MSSSQKRRVDEEEDLDDLDDVLDQFSPAQSSQQKVPSTLSQSNAASASKSPQPTLAAASDDEFTIDFGAELAREMESLFKGLGLDPQAASGSVGSQSSGQNAQGMEALLKGLGIDPQPVSDSINPMSGGENGAAAENAERERAFAAAWEAMLVEGMDDMVPQSSHAGAAASSRSPKPKGEDDFQSRIRSTMNKLKESESGLKTAPTGTDAFESLLSQFEGMGDLNDTPESEEKLQGVLEAMMGQLMSKDILYEPLKELYDKFPGYLTEHSGTMSPEDKKRFDAQIICIKQLLDVFAAKDYHDEDAKTRGKIVELMGELQNHGSPPEEIMGPLPPGFNMGADGLPNVPENCVIS